MAVQCICINHVAAEPCVLSLLWGFVDWCWCFLLSSFPFSMVYVVSVEKLHDLLMHLFSYSSIYLSYVSLLALFPYYGGLCLTFSVASVPVSLSQPLSLH